MGRVVKMQFTNSGIYKILCLETDKFYIGSSKTLKKRFYEHKRQLKNNKHPNRYLQFAWNKYKELNFVFIIIEYSEVEKLIEREQHYIDRLKPEYNLAPTAQSMLNFKHSEETKRIISEKASNISEETRAKMKAHVFSDEHKKNMSIARKKRVTTEETKLKLSEAGKKRNALVIDPTNVIIFKKA